MFQNEKLRIITRDLETYNFEITVLVFKTIGLGNRVKRLIQKKCSIDYCDLEKGTFYNKYSPENKKYCQLLILSEDFEELNEKMNRHQKDGIHNMYSLINVGNDTE